MRKAHYFSGGSVSKFLSYFCFVILIRRRNDYRIWQEKKTPKICEFKVDTGEIKYYIIDLFTGEVLENVNGYYTLQQAKIVYNDILRKI